jgi:predicted RNA binding protein YcfA (HicA-like mRNA interferase family)
LSEALPVVSGRQTIKTLTRLGFEQVSQRGSHVKMRSGSLTVIIPLHDELARGTLRSILRQANLTNEEFLAEL